MQLTTYLIGFHIPAREIFDAIREALLAEFVVRQQEVGELSREDFN